MSSDEDKNQHGIHITRNDVLRAAKKVKEFQKLLDRGKTPQEIFQDLLKVIDTD